MKKILAVLIALSVNNVFAYYDSQIVDGVKWYYDRISDGNGGYSAQITYKDRNYNSYDNKGKISIPAKLGGYAVTSIGEAAFYGCSILYSITIPDTVTSIGGSAFYNCSGLESIVIPNGVTSIKATTFYGCKKLKSITIPTSVTTIGWGAFEGCSSSKIVYIADIAKWCAIDFADEYSNPCCVAGHLYLNGEEIVNAVVPDGVVSLGRYVFCGCSLIKSIAIPKSVTSIDALAFKGTNPTAVYIEDLTVWCSTDFTDDWNGVELYLNGEKLVHVIIPDGMTSIGRRSFYRCKSIESIAFPDGVTTIGNGAFCGCSSLRSIALPNYMETIGDNAFYDCSSLASITIPESVTMIGKSAFANCSSLKTVNIWDLAKWCEINFANASANPCYFGGYLHLNGEVIEHAVIPNGVTSVGDYAFYKCNSIKSITIPEGVMSIGNNAFAGCGLLSSVVLPNSLTSIGNDIFSQCNAIQEVSGWQPGIVISTAKKISVSSCVTSIPEKAFYNHKSVSSVTIPNGVTSIGNNAFCSCQSLSSILIPNSVTSIGDNAFKGCSSLGLISIPDGVISIGAYAFYSCSSLTSITISKSVSSIGFSAFGNCSALSAVYIDDLAKWCEITFGGSGGASNPCYYGGRLYLNGEEIICAVIPDGVKSIAECAFHGCSSLQSVTVPASVTSIGDYAFDNCNALETIVLLDGVTSIGGFAFYNCASLQYVTIPESVKSIGAKLFYGCNKLKEIIGWRPGLPANVERLVVSPSVTRIAASAFSACDALTSLTIPEGVVAIENNAFNGCANLVHISFPESLRSFGDNDMRELRVCEGAEGLCVKDGWVLGYIGTAPEVVTIPEGVVGIASHAFERQTDIGTVHLPKSLKYIGVKAFRNCTWLQDLNLPVGLEKIDVAAFENCTSLDHLVCPEGLLEIGADAFKDCWRMLSVSLPASLGLIGSNAFSGCTSLVGATLPAHIRPVSEVLPDVYGNLTEIIIAEGSTKVCENAFVGCVALTSVVVPGSVISIDTGAFRGCEYLGAISFKPGLVRIGTEAFKGCVRLSAVEFPDTLEEIGVGAFKECNRLTSVTFSDGLCKIDDSAFYGASGIVSLKFPQSLRSIGSKAFYGLQNLRSIQFADGLAEIGAEAFKGCGCLPSVEFPEGLETIGDSAFYESAGISSLKFPKSLRSIGANAFYGLQDLKSVEIPEGVSEVGAGAFANCANIQEVSMPVGAWTVEGVFTTAYNKISSVQVVGAPTTLPDGFLRNCSAIKEFEIPKTIQTIGVEAFKGTALLAINLPSGLKSIGASAFYGLTAPSVLILPEGLEVIGGSAFYGCSSITEVEIPMGIEHLEASTFASCAKLVKVVLPASLTSINGTAFSNDAAIRSVSLPGGLGTLKTIFPNAYDKISEVTIDESSSGLCESFMDGCKSVLAVGVPAGVKTIGKNAFRNCAALESFALPTGVTTISEGIFSGCTRLSSIVFPSEVISLGANIFNGCTALASVYFLGSAPNVDVNVYSGTPTTLTTYVVKGSVEWDGIPNSKALPKAWPTTNGRTITYWEPNVFDVTFFGNGGTPELQVVSETTGTTYIMPQENPSRVGATFAGWWTEPVNGGQVKGTMRVDLTRPHSFYAHWRFNLYTVRFEANGADGEMPTLAMTVDEPMNLPSSGFVRIDHDFVGWALEPEGEVVFTDGAEVVNLSMEDGETVRLYAVWAEREWSAADYLGAKGQVLTSDGDAVWFPDAGTSHDGIGSMRSGEIGIANAGETTRSTLRTTVAGNGTLTFWWKVNCEGPDPDYGDLYDYLEFTIDGVRPTAVEPIAGDVDWVEVEVRIEGAVPTHELAWSFVKDDWDEEALPDVAWVDELIWTPDTVTVSFDGNGATDGDVPSAMDLVAGSELVLPEAGTLHKRTCKFGGWTDGIKTYAAGETYIVGAADVMFSAVWIEFTIADALNASELVFTTGGDAVWTVDFETSHDGEASVRSGVVGTSQESWIETKVDGAGTLTFVWKADGFVYRNNPANYVQYVVDGGETVKVAVCDWTEVEIEVTGAGEHTVRWSYSHTRSQASGGDCAWLDEVGWVATEVPLSPTVEGDEGATVTGDAETGFVVKPSEGKTAVEVTIPQGVDAAKVTVEVSVKVASVKPNGATVKVVSGGADITGFLNVPAADGNGVVDLTKATVKEEIVKEAMDPAKGAKIELNSVNPTLITPNTRVGLFYQLREGTTLEGMSNGDSTIGDGNPWKPEIKVKGGNAAFYSIGVGKGE